MGDAVKSIVESISKYKNLSELVVQEDTTQIIKVNNYINKNIDLSAQELKNLGLNVVTIGVGDRIIDQYPAKGNKITKGSKIYVLTNSEKIYMPSMIGWTSSDAKNFCNLTKLKCKIEGYGTVNNQSIKAGDEINPEVEIHITLARKKGETDKEEKLDDKTKQEENKQT